MILKKDDERIIYLDVIKAMSIILVVYCHFVLLPDNSVAGNIFMTCAWVGVPCFMITSGALMHKSDVFVWKKYLFKLLSTYLILCIWKVIYLLVYMIGGILPDNAWQTVSYVFFFGSVDGIDTSVMWYMNAYLIILLLYPVTHYLFKQSGTIGRRLMLFLVILTGTSGILIFSLNWIFQTISIKTSIDLLVISGMETIFPFTNFANLLFYFLIGGFLFEYRELMLKKKNLFILLSLTGFVIGILGLIIIKYLDTSAWTWSGLYIANGYNHISTLIASLSFYIFLSLFEYKGFFTFLCKTTGQCTLGIYYMHYILLAVCSSLIYKKLPEYFFGMNIVKTLIVVIVCTAITCLLRKIPIIKHLVK